MRIKIKGQSMPVKNLDTARIRDVAELQQQTGSKLQQLRADISASDAISAAVLIFLSMHNAGLPITWDEVQDITFDQVQILQDPGDTARSSEGEESDPPQPSGASAPDGDAQAEEWPPQAD